MATVNNNWPTPVATDLVKDGWEAIKDLGDAIDTTLGVYADPGLVLLNTTSFSGVSSQSVNDVFSATYTHYLVLPYFLGSIAGTGVAVRLRVAGADNSSAEYRRQRLFGVGASAGADRTTGATSWNYFSSVETSTYTYAQMTIVNPFAASPTTAQSTFSGSPTGNLDIVFTQFTNDASTSYTGFTLIPDSGTITGSVSVYGYNK
jgi:hypothetical protein